MSATCCAKLSISLRSEVVSCIVFSRLLFPLAALEEKVEVSDAEISI